MSEPAEIPQGFEELRRANSRFLSSLGPLYSKAEGSGVVIGLRLEERHLNTRGVAHGGDDLVADAGEERDDPLA